MDSSSTATGEYRLSEAECEEKLRKAESLLVQAGRASDAVQMYMQRAMQSDAVRVCKKHCPQLLGELIDGSSDGQATIAQSGA